MDLTIDQTDLAHQFSVSCSDEDDLVSFGPVTSETFIVHQYCEQSQPTEIRIQAPCCSQGDTSAECTTDVLNTLFYNSVQELVQFPTSIRAILVDSDGNHIENPGTESTADGLCSVVNPWTMSVSLSGGPSDAMLSGTTDVWFSGGVAEFNDLNIDMEGSGYSLTFEISQSSQGNAVSPLTLSLPDVVTRPLSFKVTSSPSLEKLCFTI